MKSGYIHSSGIMKGEPPADGQPADQPTTLAPCPFCSGDRPQTVDVFDYLRKTDGKKMSLRHIVRCFDCGSQTRELGSEGAAIEKWNTRATSTAVKDERLRIAEELDRRGLKAWGKSMVEFIAELRGEN